MSHLIPNEIIQTIIARSDIVECIQSRITLSKRGNNFLARCPFHEEKTPSFTVNQSKQFYYCFGCGANGNIISFLINYDRLDFVNAVEYLAGQLGIELNYTNNQNQTLHNNHKNTYEVLQKVANFYQDSLYQHEEAIHYLKTRKLNKEICQKFEIGYASPNWHNLSSGIFRSNNIKEILFDHGLSIKNKNGNYYDRFRNRIIFPIHDIRGRIIAFGSRCLDGQSPKYLNSPETNLFYKNQELYGLYQAKQAKQNLENILVVEGYLDVITLHKFGFTNAVATMGTALNAKHIQKLLRFTNKIIFCFDGDAAGYQAAVRSIQITFPFLEDGIEIAFLLLPNQEDPDSLLNNAGAESFKHLISTKTLPINHFLFQHLAKNLNLKDAAQKAFFAKEVHHYLEILPSGFYRHLLIQQLAELLNVSLSELQKIKKFGLKEENLTTKAPMKSSSLKTILSSSHAHAINLLLINPRLASLSDYLSLTNLFPANSILLKLIHFFQKNPNSNIGHLLAEWEWPEEKEIIAELANQELLIPEQNLELEYLGTLKRIEIEEMNKKIQHLINKNKQNHLNHEEKRQLQLLLAEKHKQ